MARPTGAKDKPPEVPIRAARRALKDVRQRAEEGSPEDQRVLLMVYAVDRLPPGFQQCQIG